MYERHRMFRACTPCRLRRRQRAAAAGAIALATFFKNDAEMWQHLRKCFNLPFFCFALCERGSGLDPY
jgi:hypothetical protein